MGDINIYMDVGEISARRGMENLFTSKGLVPKVRLVIL